MKKNLKTILREGHIHTLSRDHKSDIKAQVISFVEKNPVRAENAIRLRGREHAGAFSFMSLLPQKRMTVVLLSALLVGGGTSYAAEGARPGDFLYTVKVSVNEEVRSALTVSAESKAEWDTVRAERRLEEAVILAASGELSADKRETLEQKFETHIYNAEEFYAQAEVRGDADVAIVGRTKIEATRGAHIELLRDIQLMTDNEQEVGVLLASLESQGGLQMATMMKDGYDTQAFVAMRTLESVDENLETSVTVSEASVRARMNLAKRTLARAGAEFEKNKHTLSVRIQQDVDAKLVYANELFAQGEGSLKTEMHSESLLQFQESFALAHEMYVYVRTVGKIQKYMGDEYRISIDERVSEEQDSNQSVQFEIQEDVRVRMDTMQEDSRDVLIERRNDGVFEGENGSIEAYEERGGQIDIEARVRVDVAL